MASTRTKKEYDDDSLLQASITVNAFMHDAEPFGEKVKRAFGLKQREHEEKMNMMACARSLLHALPHMEKKGKAELIKALEQRFLPNKA